MTDSILFISDLHLDPSRPEVNLSFAEFLSQRAMQASALYILGDLFEYWVGDDQPVKEMEAVLAGLNKLHLSGIPIYFIHGNRDFLLGSDFAKRCGLEYLQDGTVVDLFGTPTLIMHGDVLCTDDKEYQTMRALLRSEGWQAQFLALPLQERLAQAQALRQQSRDAQQAKSEYIMDVNQEAVEQSMNAAGVTRLIHGHTHRPAIHEFSLGDQMAQRIVLGDWYDQGSVLEVSRSGVELTRLPFS